MPSRYIVLIIKFLFAAALLTWLVQSGRLDFAVIEGDLTHPVHALGILFVLATLIPQSIRWHGLMKSQNIVLPLSRIIKWNWIGEFFALTLPGGAGTELSRGYYAFKNSPNSRAAALSTVVMDRYFGLISLLFIGATSAVFILQKNILSNTPIIWLAVILIFTFLTGIIFWFLIYLKSVRKIICKFFPKKYSIHLEEILEDYIGNNKLILYVFFLSVVNHVLVLGLFFLSGLILDLQLPWEVVFFVVPYVMVSNIIPLTPAGIGVGEVAAAYLFLQFNVPEGAAIMLIVRMWLIFLQLSGGLVFLLYREKATAH